MNDTAQDAELKITDHRSGQDPEVVSVIPVEQQDHSMAAMVHSAITRGADKDYLDSLERLFALQVKAEEREAKKAYVKAMAEFKKNPPSIYKNKDNSQFKSRYSSIDAVVNPTIPLLAAQGVSHNWSFGNTDSMIEVTCTLTHELGHSESVTIPGPADTSGAKNDIQQIRSTHTYLKIATFEAVTGLVSREGNSDDDGNGAGSKVQYITDKQVSQIVDMVNATEGIDMDAIFKKAQIKDIREMPKDKYGKAFSYVKNFKPPKKDRQPGED